jgi:cytochrome c nitrite reductase small subunit
MRSVTGNITLGVLVGVLVALGLYTFVYAKGYSYLTNNPNACQNCHVMQNYYSAWITSSHHDVATCNDCHTPHNIAGKYAIKVSNGFLHSFAFTTGRFPDVIQIKGYNDRVTEGTCKWCHAELTSSIVGIHSGKDISCIKCHFNVGHSAAPVSFTSVTPESAPAANEPGAPSSEGTQNGNSEQH